MPKNDIVYPYNLEAEQSVLGSILIDSGLQYEIIGKLRESDFYLESHKLIFSAMSEIIGRNTPVDLVTLADELDKSATLEKAGGIAYLTKLAESNPSAANYEYHLGIVKRDGTLRKLIKSANEIIDEAANSSDSSHSLAVAEKSIYDISEQLDSSQLVNVNTKLGDVLKKFENIQKDKDYFQGIKTGFTELDRLTQGLHAGNLIILAARPSVGKSTLAMNIVENVAIREGAVCAVFALEMTKEELAQRMLCSVAGVSRQAAVEGKLKDEDWQKLFNAKKIITNAKVFIDDYPIATTRDITSKCRRLKNREGRLDLVVVDHMQLMDSVKKHDNRQGEITEISRGLKNLSKDLEVPVLALSQLNRQVTARKGRPMLSDLRESGAIEQDADVVMFIHRPDMDADAKEIESGKVKKNVAEIIMAKNREGENRTFELIFKGEQSKFINMPASYVSDMGIPPERRGAKPAFEDDAPAPTDAPPKSEEEIMVESDEFNDIF